MDREQILTGQVEAKLYPTYVGHRYPPPDYGFNFFNRRGHLYEPVLDNSRLEKGGVRPEWPGGRKFAVCLTHDVDHVARYSVRQSGRRLRRTVEDVLTDDGSYDLRSGVEDTVRAAFRAVESMLHTGSDPLHNFERWMDIEDDVGARSTFFFLPEKVTRAHFSDGNYRYSDDIQFGGKRITVGELMEHMEEEGWEVGLHGSWYSFDSPEELREQKSQIESQIGRSVASVRQHILNYDIQKTPRAHAEAGLLADSSLGFNRNVGFRFGTCYPWTLLTEDGRHEILEIPLIIQDVALFSNNALGLNADTAFDYIKMITARVKAVGGVLTLLWHPDAPWHSSERWRVYRRTVEYLATEGAWFGTLREVAEQWRNSEVAESWEVV